MCQYCRRLPCVPQCPNYKQKDSDLYCKGCGGGIHKEEQYMQIGDFCYHRECAFELTAREIFKTLKIESQRKQ